METFRFDPEPSSEEAAALVAAIEQFLRDSTPAAPPPIVSPWKRRALAEGIAQQPCTPAPWA
jgi:hypothetical protein